MLEYSASLDYSYTPQSVDVVKSHKLEAYLSFRTGLQIIHRLLYTQHLFCACVFEIF